VSEVKHHSHPFGVTEDELLKVESFCAANKLDEVGRICAELRVLRAEYLTLCKRVGMTRNSEPDPILANRRFSKTLRQITKEDDPNDFPEA
jgi:hypothetical protein